MGSTQTGAVLESIVIIANEDLDGDIPTNVQPSEIRPQSQGPLQTWMARNRSWIFGVASKLAAIATLVLTALMAWPAIESSSDTRMATLLAKWTSWKDFMEFCEAHDWESSECAPFRNTTLPAPPTKLPLLRRFDELRAKGDLQSVQVGIVVLILAALVSYAGFHFFVALHKGKTPVRKRWPCISIDESSGAVMRAESVSWLWVPKNLGEESPYTTTTGAETIWNRQRMSSRRSARKRKERRTSRQHDGADLGDTSSDDIFGVKPEVGPQRRRKVRRIKQK